MTTSLLCPERPPFWIEKRKISNLCRDYIPEIQPHTLIYSSHDKKHYQLKVKYKIGSICLDYISASLILNVTLTLITYTNHLSCWESRFKTEGWPFST